MNTMTKANLGRKLCSLTVAYKFISRCSEGRSQCRSHGKVLLTVSLSLLSHRTWADLPKDGSTHNGLGPPPLITN